MKMKYSDKVREKNHVKKKTNSQFPSIISWDQNLLVENNIISCGLFVQVCVTWVYCSASVVSYMIIHFIDFIDISLILHLAF